jgi:hypothetical protein
MASLASMGAGDFSVSVVAGKRQRLGPRQIEDAMTKTFAIEAGLGETTGGLENRRRKKRYNP